LLSHAAILYRARRERLVQTSTAPTGTDGARATLCGTGWRAAVAGRGDAPLLSFKRIHDELVTPCCAARSP